MTDILRTGNSKSRLATYRAKAADAKNWRYWKPSQPTAAPNNVRGPQGQIYSKTIDQYGEELSARADDRNCGFNASGFYADNFQDATIEPRVCRMRCPRGTLYIPATLNTQEDGTVHYLQDAELVPKGADEDAHDKGIREAMRSAYHYAEQEADACREDDAKFQAEQQIETAQGTIAEERAQLHALIAELRTVALPPALCSLARNGIRQARKEAHRAVKRIRALTDNYWLSVG